MQLAKRLREQRVIAVGRDPEALEKLSGLGADAVISLSQDKGALVAAFRKEWVEAGGVDVVLDYLWGAPAESLLEAISQKGLEHAAASVRFGSAPVEQIVQAAGDF